MYNQIHVNHDISDVHAREYLFVLPSPWQTISSPFPTQPSASGVDGCLKDFGQASATCPEISRSKPKVPEGRQPSMGHPFTGSEPIPRKNDVIKSVKLTVTILLPAMLKRHILHVNIVLSSKRQHVTNNPCLYSTLHPKHDILLCTHRVIDSYVGYIVHAW